VVPVQPMSVYRFSHQYKTINDIIFIYSSHSLRHVSVGKCVTVALHDDGRNYRPKHFVVNVMNK